MLLIEIDKIDRLYELVSEVQIKGKYIDIY